jgi:hypothetical protein
MGKAKITGKPAISARRKMRGSILNLWHVVFFVSGVAAMGLFQLVLISIDHSRSDLPAERTPGSAPRGNTRPWGELEITSMFLDRPEAHFESNNAPAPALRWTFQNYSVAQLAQFINSCDLTGSQKAALLDTNKWQRATNGWQITPEPDLVKEINVGAREKIYSVLGQSRQNSQAFPFIFELDSFEQVLTTCELPAEKIALVRHLSYPKKSLRCFADLQLFDLLSTSNETRCLTKALCRVPTVLMKLKVTPQSDLKTLLDYWGGCCNADRIKPLLESVIRVREGAELNVSFFMPPVPRLNLYTYPNPASQVGQDCVWSAFNFFLDQSDNRFTDPEYANKVLQSDFEPIRGEKIFGDLLLLQEGDRAVHMCVYVAADIVYTKNGGHHFQPWILMKLDDVMVQYASDKPQQLRVFRKKSVALQSAQAKPLQVEGRN